ncbi:MAG: hypothetical protein NTV80_01215 [Verrucomicrobia bacterium]|nr:hypothetical protein [Verrucomicrobiota bacterium]
MKLKRQILLAAFCLFWLVPFFWVGIMRPLPFRVPPRLHTAYACAALFTRRIQTWDQKLIQVRYAPDGPWLTPDIQELSPMRVFGFRQRLERLLIASTGRKTNSLLWQRLAEWVVLQQVINHPDSGKVSGVRFAEQVWQVHSSELLHPRGAWNSKTSDVSSARFRVLASFDIIQDKATPTSTNKQLVKKAQPFKPEIFRRSHQTSPEIIKENLRQ